MKVHTLPYGTYSIDVKGRTIVLTIKGVVDMEVALRFMLDFKIQVTELGEKHWASLVDLSEWGLHPPEVVYFLDEFEDWAKNNGQIAEAAVVDASVLKVMARDKLVAPHRDKVHQEYFQKKAVAEEWLRHLSLYED